MALENTISGANSSDPVKEMQIAARQRVIFNRNFTSLFGDFSFADKTLKEKSIAEVAEDIMKKYPEESNETSLLRLKKQEPGTSLLLMADLHGDYRSWKYIANSLLAEYAEGKNAYLGILGDPNHPLMEQLENGEVAALPINNKLVPTDTELSALVKREQDLFAKIKIPSITPKEREEIRTELRTVLGLKMYKKNLAIKDEEHNRFVLLPYH